MSGVLHWLKRALIAVVALVVVLLAGGLVYRGVSQWRVVAATRIETPNGVESLEAVELGGVEQWLYLRGNDRDKPVLLYVHGGPGAPEMAYARDFGLRLEEHFVVVHWDQRGAGKSCTSDVPDDSLRLEQYLADTVELVELLRRRFGVERVFLLGHSWGSVLGVLTAQRHPELLHAYIGMGQVVNMRRGEEISYRFVLDRAKAENNDEALRELAAVHPPYPDTADLLVQRSWLSHYRGDFYAGGAFSKLVQGALLAPEYSFLDLLSFYPCVLNSIDQAWGDLQELDFIRSVPRLEVPVYFLTGRHDYNTPFELVESYYEILDAPHKEIIWFEHSAHSPNLEEPERFQEVLIHNILAADSEEEATP